MQKRLAAEFEVSLLPMINTRFPLDANRNESVDTAINVHKADFIMFLDADMTFPEDVIPKLMGHISEETPIVSGIYWLKKPPYRCISAKYVPNEKISDFDLKRKSLEREEFLAPDGQQTLYTTPIKTFEVVEPVDVAGMGCVLVSSEVFRRLKQPYFRYVNEYGSGGDFTFKGGASEEMWFYSECRKAGIKTLIDPSVRCGHLVEREIMGNQVD